MKPALFYANDRQLATNKFMLRYGVLGGVYPLTSVFAQTNSLIAVANAMLAKTLPAFYLQQKIYYLPEARILTIEILVFFFQNETMHGHGFASIAYGCPYAQLTKFETIFAAFLLGCSALRPNSAHLRFRRMYGIVFIPAMRQRKE